MNARLNKIFFFSTLFVSVLMALGVYSTVQANGDSGGANMLTALSLFAFAVLAIFILNVRSTNPKRWLRITTKISLLCSVLLSLFSVFGVTTINNLENLDNLVGLLFFIILALWGAFTAATMARLLHIKKQNLTGAIKTVSENIDSKSYGFAEKHTVLATIITVLVLNGMVVYILFFM